MKRLLDFRRKYSDNKSIQTQNVYPNRDDSF